MVYLTGYARPFRAATDQGIKHRYRKEGKHGSKDHSTYEHDSDTVSRSTTRTRCDNERKMPHHRRN
jgi:hypothetical protein